MTLSLEEMKANRRKWVEALRSGKYQQAKSYLVRDGGYCCLGVLANIAGVSDERMGGEAALRELPEVLAFVGLRDIAGRYDDDRALAAENDRGRPFDDIADIIESEPPGLFIDSTPTGSAS